MSGRVRVFIACSLDGFIAGPGGDLSWLPQPKAENPEDYGYNHFFSGIGALLMGRRTFDVVRGFGGRWPYGDTPVIVASRSPVVSNVPSVRGLGGSIRGLLQIASEAAGSRDVYLDGGELIRQALDEDLLDELTVSVVPTVLGAGVPLFSGLRRRRSLTLVASHSFPDGLVQSTYNVDRHRPEPAIF